jgi:hypothetical protein
MSMYPVTPIPQGPNLPSQVLAELMKVGAKPPVPSEHRLTERNSMETPMSLPIKGLKSFAMPNRPFNHLEG